MTWTGSGAATGSEPGASGWPTQSDIETLITATGAAVPSEWAEGFAAELSAVTTEIERLTGRQFAADAEDSTHYYDGNGAHWLAIPDMVSLTSAVSLYGDGTTECEYTDAVLSTETGEEDGPLCRLLATRKSVAGYRAGAYFPTGRQNIRVIGRRGYAASIPSDIWQAAAREVLRRLTGDKSYSAGGAVKKEKAGEVEREFAVSSGGALGTYEDFARVCDRYRRVRLRRVMPVRGPML